MGCSRPVRALLGAGNGRVTEYTSIKVWVLQHLHISAVYREVDFLVKCVCPT